jgi:hypothetical protein
LRYLNLESKWPPALGKVKRDLAASPCGGYKPTPNLPRYLNPESKWPPALGKVKRDLAVLPVEDISLRLNPSMPVRRRNDLCFVSLPTRVGKPSRPELAKLLVRNVKLLRMLCLLRLGTLCACNTTSLLDIAVSGLDIDVSKVCVSFGLIFNVVGNHSLRNVLC